MKTKNRTVKYGHQTPKGFVVDRFNSVEIDGDFAYCESHNFIYNTEEENRKLYDGKPCYHTDVRFYDGPFNFYGNCHLHWTRWKDISLKACIRKTLRCRNIPMGTVVDFRKSWFVPGKKFSNSYRFVVRKENMFEPEYEVNIPSYSENFTSCERSMKLVDALRQNGFLVMVERNHSRLMDMINSACQLTGKETVDPTIDGEIAIAYGFGKKIGFSSFDNDFMGYHNGKDSILWDRFGEFDKWSRCYQIPKGSSIGEILEVLKSENPKEEEETIEILES